jgi:hypothetical protein
VEDLGADLAALAARPDDGDRRGLKQPLHRRERGSRGSLRGVLFEGRRGSDGERDLLDAASHLPLLRLEAAVAEDIDHPPVVAEHLRLEGRDSVAARDLREPFEQPRTDALALQRVLDGEGDLRALGLLRQTEVVSDRHDPAAGLADEGELVVVVHAAEARCLVSAHVGNREEPKVEAVGRQATVERQQLPGILGPDGAQTQSRSGPEDDVPFLFGRIRGVGGRSGPGGSSHRSFSERLAPPAARPLMRLDHMTRALVA